MSKLKDFDKYRKYGAYHWRQIIKRQEYRDRVDAVCQAVKPDYNCLDLGCGDGAYMYYVAQMSRHVVGVDADADGILCAQQALGERGINNITLVQSAFADLEGRLPPEIQRYDLIYSMDCIEHLYNPQELLDLIDRYLAQDGVFIVGTPLFVTKEAVSSYHVKEFTESELEALLEPRFEKIRARYLQAPAPPSKETLSRFYVYYARRRGQSIEPQVQLERLRDELIETRTQFDQTRVQLVQVRGERDQLHAEFESAVCHLEHVSSKLREVCEAYEPTREQLKGALVQLEAMRTYYGQLRFRLAERANRFIKVIPGIHLAARASVAMATAVARLLGRRAG